ncbi:DUF1194 domain-containing protein [Pontivivens ytuae]|uniref:DUF1194 domain-containing protein n=1 Tax=Pontivivens ytuae TaxID=2789856 RepID=A0A7S9LTQ9_9RHOB|nr:DUF1194 domain-containing protein [Pontivivens ytuae]QPH54971.1 DUF1194 domain-containing protein [Pontivivens ytuae]
MIGRVLLIVMLLTGPAASQTCRLALQLALDISSSVDPREYGLQMEGTARALEDPEIRAAFLVEPTVYLTVWEWSGQRQQMMIVDWVPIQTAFDLDRVAQRMRGHRRTTNREPTALGSALAFGIRHFANGPADCEARAIDVSGDGESNDGFPPSSAYRAYDWTNVAVNALVIGGDRHPSLTAYFQTEVIRGPQAFVEVAAGYGDYERAIRRKLLRELQPTFLIGQNR